MCEVQKDCVFYRNGEQQRASKKNRWERCQILTELMCSKRECSFKKTLLNTTASANVNN